MKQPTPPKKSAKKPSKATGKAVSAAGTRAAVAKTKAKNTNKPGPMDNIGRAAALVKRGVLKNPSNPNGYSNMDKAFGRNDTRSITKMPGDIAKGLDFVVRKATPLPDRKKTAPKKKK